MNTIELLEIGKSILSIMSKNNIKRDDFKYIDAYNSFLNMRKNKIKYRSAIHMLSEENNISERTLERIFKRLSKENLV